jgi:hypothetical protein
MLDSWFDQAQRRCEEIVGFTKRSYRSLGDSSSIGDFIVRSGERLRAACRFFLGLNVVILGPPGGGKTTFINMMRTGQPAEHNPTAGVALIDRRFEVTPANWLKVRSDVGGDPLYHALWATLIVETDPEVIIFILDGRKSIEEVVGDMRTSMKSAFAHRQRERGRLRVLYVLINFWDVWNLDPVKNDVLRSRVQLTVDEEKATYGLSGLTVGAWPTQMNPNASQWPELDKALQHLGKDLGA